VGKKPDDVEATAASSSQSVFGTIMAWQSSPLRQVEPNLVTATQPAPINVQVFLGSEDVSDLVSVRILAAPATLRRLDGLAANQRNMVI